MTFFIVTALRTSNLTLIFDENHERDIGFAVLLEFVSAAGEEYIFDVAVPA
jgi:hypothetical protein